MFQRARKSLPDLIRKDSNVFVKKPLPVEVPSDSSGESTPLNRSDSNCSSYESFEPGGDDSITSAQSLERHLSLFDLMVIGIGCTIGSGLFVLCGRVANQYAGPASSLSWAIAGLAACLSGACYAELSSRIPLAGSAYAYTFVAMGELPAILAAVCLSLEYLATAAAVARSWGDKVVMWLLEQYGSANWIVAFDGKYFSPFAFLVSAASVALLLNGVKESKAVTSIFTGLKVSLVAFMVIVGAMYVQPSNWTPFVPQQFGAAGVLRGATGTFFGYLGFDEIAVLGGEAKNPKRDLPRAIMGTISGVTVLYFIAAIILTGMAPFEEISSVSGFPAAFRDNDFILASQVTAFGEIATLPVVVLITIMGQPRLQFALAKDGLLPPLFAEVDSKGNLAKGTMICGVLMVAIATIVPFDHLNDMISCAVLTALSLTDTSLILLWHPSPTERPALAETMMGSFHCLALFTGIMLCHFLSTALGKAAAVLGVLSMVICVLWFLRVCPRSAVFGTAVHSHPTASQITRDDGYFRTPFVPIVPCLGILTNWYLVAQLELFGILLHLSFLGIAILYYLLYAIHHSVGNNGGWGSRQREATSESINVIRTEKVIKL